MRGLANSIARWNSESNLIVLLLAAAVMVRTMAVNYPREARVFPVLVSTSMIVLLAIALIGHLRSGSTDRVDEDGSSGGASEAGADTVASDGGEDEGAKQLHSLPWWGTLAGAVGLLGLMYMFGFGAGIALYYPIFARQLGMPLKVGIGVGLLFAIVVRYTLSSLFYVPMPTGRLFHLF